MSRFIRYIDPDGNTKFINAAKITEATYDPHSKALSIFMDDGRGGGSETRITGGEAEAARATLEALARI